MESALAENESFLLVLIVYDVFGCYNTLKGKI